MTDDYVKFKGTEPADLGDESKGKTFTVPKEYFVYVLIFCFC